MKTYNNISTVFDVKIAPAFVGFSANDIQKIKECYIANTLDNYYEWHAVHLDALAELIEEYDASFLRSIYRDSVNDGESPAEAFYSIVCCALERDL